MAVEWEQAGCACGANNKAMILFIDNGPLQSFAVECAKCGDTLIAGRCVDHPGLLDRVKLPKVKAKAKAKTIAQVVKKMK